MDADLRSGPLAVAGWVCQADNLLQMFCKVYISKYTGKIRHVLISTLVRSGMINNPVSLPYQHIPGGQAHRLGRHQQAAPILHTGLP